MSAPKVRNATVKETFHFSLPSPSPSLPDILVYTNFQPSEIIRFVFTTVRTNSDIRAREIASAQWITAISFSTVFVHELCYHALIEVSTL